MTGLVLWAPEEYWNLTKEEKQHYLCGPGRGLLEKFVPDVWYFGWPLVKPLRITPSCSIHDFTYAWGPDTIEWKQKSDRAFLNNLLRQVEHAAFECGSRFSILTSPITRVRIRKAGLYYHAVDKFGGPAFWSGRNLDKEVGCVLA